MCSFYYTSVSILTIKQAEVDRAKAQIPFLFLQTISSNSGTNYTYIDGGHAYTATTSVSVNESLVRVVAH